MNKLPKDSLWVVMEDNNLHFTPNPNYYVMIRCNSKGRFKMEIWKKRGITRLPIFLIGYADSPKEAIERIHYALTHQYADISDDWGYELD